MSNENSTLSDEKLTVLAEHYNNSVDIMKQDIKYRDKYFFIFIALVSILFVKISDYNLFELIIIKLLDLKETTIPSHNFSSLALWFLSLLCFIKYTQFHSTIERDYKYLTELECCLNSNYSGNIFRKEGFFYKSGKTHIKNTNKIILKYIAPILFSLVIVNNLYIIFIGEINPEKIFESIIVLILLHHITFFTKES